jgi:hypothetical protein
MARVFSTPGVYRREIDLSEILVAQGISNGGIVVKAKKGPVNRPVLVTNDKEYIDTFGEPIYTSGYANTEIGKLTPDYGYGAYGALEFLKESTTLYVVRGFDSNDKYSNIEIRNASTLLDFSADSDGIVGNAWVKGDRLDAKDYISIIDEYVTNSASSNVVFGALGPGKDGDNIAITIEPFSLSADWKLTYDEYPDFSAVSATSLAAADITRWYPIASKVAKVNVYTKSTAQTWDSLYRNNTDRTNKQLYINPVETFYGSLSEDLMDGNKNNLFIEKVINGNSKYIYVKKGNGVGNFPALTGTDTNGLIPYGTTSAGDEYVKFDGTFTGTSATRLMVLSGGASPLTASDTVTGWNIFEDRENVNVQILVGLSNDTVVKQEMGRIAATRADCITTVQAGTLTDDTTTEVIGTEQYGYRTPSYVAIYGGYSKIYDQYNDKFVYLPNSILGAELFARVDNIANPWDAPAGINRAVLSVLDQRKIFVGDEIGKLYDRNINVPKFIRGTGHVMWGQKTAQLKASALDRINVRRNLLYIENNCETALLPFVFENNTAKTRLRVWSLIDEFLAGVQAGGGLTAYQVVCDETNNTSAIIDANRLEIAIYLQPSRTIEYIQLTTVITRTGISFEEIRIATA